MQCWKFEGEFAWYTWKWHLSTIFIHSATQDTTHFSASRCHVLLTHWRPYYTEMWLCWWTDERMMLWFSSAVVKCWPVFICIRGSNATTDIELYVHLHQRRTAPHTISPETVMCVSFHQSLLDAWVTHVCLIHSHDVSLQVCVCVWTLIHNMTK